MRRIFILSCLCTLILIQSNFEVGAHDREHFPQERYQGMIVEPTLPVATDVPDRVLASWKSDPATSFSVTWRSKQGEDCVAEIALATAGPQFLKNIERANGETTRLETSLGNVHMHSVTFSELDPDTLYTYRVGSRRSVELDKASKGAQHPESSPYAWSEWFHIKTAKTFTDTVQPLRFVYVGDAQNDVKSLWSRLIRESFRDAPRMTFMLHAGDLVNHGNHDHEWGQWFHAGDFIFATIPQIAVPGNHEYDRDPFHPNYEVNPQGRYLSRRWSQRFELPENGPQGFTENAFFIDIQGVRVIGLDSQSKDIELQAQWLEQVLKNNKSRWTIITHHHPIYSTSRGRDNQVLREHWQPIYERYGVDLVLQGHDHSYGRSGQITAHTHQHDEESIDVNLKTGKRVVTPDGGPVYVVSVSGPKMYPLKEYPNKNPFNKHIANTQLYQVIEIDHNKISFVAKTPTGETVDQFQIVKDSQGKSEFIE